MKTVAWFVTAAALAAAALGQDAAESRPAAVDRSARRWLCASDPSDLPPEDPTRGPVPMPNALPGWNAFHLFKTDSWRIHAVGVARLTDAYGTSQIVVLDEAGRCVVLQPDSGNTSARVVVEDGRACSAWAAGDLDPRVDGVELYVGGGTGNLYRVVHAGRHGYRTETLGRKPEGGYSKFLLGDLAPSRPGNELISFANSGVVTEIHPPSGDDKSFRFEDIGDLGSRVRDVALLSGSQPRMAALMQDGEVALVTRTRDGIERTALCKEPMSLSRLARKPRGVGGRGPGGAVESQAEPEVLYVARCDGLILRFAERADGTWTREPIFAGPVGPRGLAAGRFDAAPGAESVAVFGYSKKVQVVTRRPGGPWRLDVVYTDPGGGHWLTAGELDGRNSTDELVGAGFSYHVFMVARQPGYGLGDVLADPDAR